MRFFEEDYETAMTTLSRSFVISEDIDIYEVADYATESGLELIPEEFENFVNEKVLDMVIELEASERALSISLYFMIEEDYDPREEGVKLIDGFMKNLEEDIALSFDQEEE